MSNWDKDRYNSLIARCAFDMSAYKGTYQDQSKNRLAMTATGAPTWAMVNGLPCLESSAGNRVASGVTASVVNSTQPFFVELLMVPLAADYMLYQVNAGGWTVYYDTSRLQVFTYTAAVGNARIIASPGASVTNGVLVHAVGHLDPVGLTGQWWIRGVPVVSSFTNTNPPVLCGNTALAGPGVVGGRARTLIARVWQGTPSNADAACLYGAARSLTGGEV